MLVKTSHSLEIEIGRHKNPKVPVDQRICNKCVLNVIEDEFHFLVICPKYDNIRKILYDKIHSVCSNFILMSDMDKFIYLLKSKEPSINNWLAKAIRQMFLL